jgi:hypothetical protein
MEISNEETGPDQDDPTDAALTIDTREGFRHALLESLDQCGRDGIAHLWLCDPDFSEWPLGQPAVVDALTRWASSRRRLTLVAGSYDHLATRCPRWLAWRRQWSHIVQCLKVLEEHASQVPMLVYGPPSVALRMQDLTRHPRGRRYRSVADIAACGELVDAISQRAEESFPATTLGL